MNSKHPSSLEMQLARIQCRETRIRQKTYSPILYGNTVVVLSKFVREDAEPIGREHPVYVELAAAGDENDLPFFLIRNDAEYTRFTVTPGNAKAHRHVSRTVEMSRDELEQLFDHCHTYRF